MNIPKVKLNYCDMIELRNHIGNSYIVAEKIPDCNPETQFEVQKRILPRYNSKGIVPIITLYVSSKKKAHSKFKEIDSICEENNIELKDIYYDKDENKMILFLEAYALKE